jgi:hypothetical protein
MKIRITDLLDDYYPKHPKLEEPEDIFQNTTYNEKSYYNQPPRERSFSLMVVAATLLLILCGASVLGLTILQATGDQTGGALADSVEVTAEPTQEQEAEAPTPTLEAQISSYCLQGDQLYAALKITGVTQAQSEWPIKVYDETFALTAESADENLTVDLDLTVNGYMNNDTLAVTVRGTLPEGINDLTFSVALESDEQQLLSNSVEMQFDPADGYALYDANYIYRYGEDSWQEGEYAELTEIHISQYSLRMVYHCPALDDDPADSPQQLQFYGDALMYDLESGTIEFDMDDGTVWYNIPLPAYEITQETESTASVFMYFDACDPIDPLEIASITFHSPTEDPDPIEYTIVGDDLDGDGYLTADLGLTVQTSDGQDVTVDSFVIDMAEGTFCWKITFPALETWLYEVSPEGDFDTALHDEDFYYGFLDYSNEMLDLVYRKTVLFLENGNYQEVGGTTDTYADGQFIVGSHFIINSQQEAGTIQPLYLTIDGVRYDFH